jgi:hypothetical protein
VIVSKLGFVSFSSIEFIVLDVALILLENEFGFKPYLLIIVLIL